MKEFEKYRRDPRERPFRTARATAKPMMKEVAESDGNKLQSSITLPLWQAIRLENATLRLKAQGIKKARYRILQEVARLSHRKIRRKSCQIHQTRKKNKTIARYKKISVRWEQEDYNMIHARADHAKICVSHLLDLGLRLYLELAVAMILGQSTQRIRFCFSSVRKDIWRNISTEFAQRCSDFCGTYHRNTKVSSPQTLFYGISMRTGPDSSG